MGIEVQDLAMNTTARVTAGKIVVGLGLSLLGLACSPDSMRDPVGPGPEGGAVATGGRRTGGATPSTGGSGPATGGATATGGVQPSTGGGGTTGGGGGTPGGGGTGGGQPVTGGAGGGAPGPDARLDGAVTADTAPAGGTDTGPLPDPGPTAPGQGPTALGQIVYTRTSSRTGWRHHAVAHQPARPSARWWSTIR